MHFRGILRLQASAGYDVPYAQSFSVQISDPDGKPAYQKTLTSNSNGIVHDEFPLPRGAALGSYYIQIHAGESVMGGNFEVQEYKKPEYEVRIAPSKPRVLEGESVSTTIDARYYFGEPVDGGKVKYSIYRTRYWFPFWYDADEDTNESEGGNALDDEAGEQIAQEEGRLDSDGKLTITIPTTVSEQQDRLPLSHRSRRDGRGRPRDLGNRLDRCHLRLFHGEYSARHLLLRALHDFALQD